MALPRNNNDPFDPGDRNDKGSFQEQTGDGKKSTWFQFHGLLGGNIDDGGSFQKHVESMITFRKLHTTNMGIRVDYQKEIQLPEYRISSHRFSRN